MTKFHAGGTRDWSLNDKTIQFMISLLPVQARTLETGAGASTVALAKRGCEHTAITPSNDEVERIKEECRTKGIDLSKVNFIIGPSQDAMPTLKGPFDFILIDGGHGFPIPQIDWFYGAQALKVGGIIAVDDVHTWTGAILRDFLDGESGWQHIETVDYKTAFYRMTKPFTYAEWDEQPFVRRRSKQLILKRKIARFLDPEVDDHRLLKIIAGVAFFAFVWGMGRVLNL